MEILQILKWPITVLVSLIIIALMFKVEFSKLLSKAKGFNLKAGGFKFETQEEKLVANQDEVVEKEQQKSLLENATKIFRPETIVLFRGYVQLETKYETLSSDHDKFNRLLDYSVIIYILKRFEWIYDNIFGSQIALLQALNSLGPHDNTIFNFYYAQAKKRYPEAYEGFSLETYPKFLFSNNLIAVDNDQKIQISILGLDFLKYLIDARKNLFKDL